MTKYRMYVDEVGNSDLKASLSNANHRYLSLTGVIVELDYARDVLRPAIEDLKQRYFGSHPDEPICLHRKELVNQRPPVDSLRDPSVKALFDAELLALLDRLDYVVITAVIDKLAHVLNTSLGPKTRITTASPYSSSAMRSGLETAPIVQAT